MKEHIKNIFNNKFVKLYIKGVKACILIILFLFCAILPVERAVILMNPWWLLIGVITWPFSFIGAYHFAEILELV